MPVRIAVLASGGGSNLQALIDRFQHRDDAPARVELVVASRPGIGALDRAGAAGILTATLATRDANSPELDDLLRDHDIQLVVLAGYLTQVPGAVVQRLRGRIVNVHPALLPAFGGKGMYGARVHRAVLESGARITGATVHLVDENYDEGPILAQWPVPVLPGDTPESLAARVLRVEHLLLPAAVEALAGGGGRASLEDPLAFEFVQQAAPSVEALERLAAVTCVPVD